MKSSIKIDFEGLKELEKLQEGLDESKQLVAKVGILGDSGARTEDGLSNAEIGAVHEFGSMTNNIPRRSFLKDPLILKRPELASFISKAIAKHIGDPDMIRQVLTKAGIVAEGIIQDAFNTGGFGTWEELKPQTIQRKGSEAKLIDKSELRGSIVSQVDSIQV